jgi:hypothetical protein
MLRAACTALLAPIPLSIKLQSQFQKIEISKKQIQLKV